MATALTTINPGADATIAAAVAGKIIRLRRVLASASSQIVAKSGTTAVLPTLVSGTNSNVHVDFAERPVVLGRGEALVITNPGAATITVYVEYDVVD